MSEGNHARTIKRVAAFVAAIFVLLALLLGGMYVFAQSFDGRIAPNVWIGPVAVGGMDPEVARQEINRRVDDFLLAGVEVASGGAVAVLPLTSIGSGDSAASADFVSLDVDGALKTAMEAHRQGPSWMHPFTLSLAYMKKEHIGLNGSLDDVRLRDELEKAFPLMQQPAMEATFVLTLIDGVWTGSVTPSEAGNEFDFDAFFLTLETQLSELAHQPIALRTVTTEPVVTTKDAEPLAPKAIAALSSTPYTLTHDPDRFTHREWPVSAEELAAALVPVWKDDEVALGVSASGLAPVLDAIALSIERPATDARFAMENGRVVEFVASSQGVSLDREKTVLALADVLGAETASAAIAVETVEPNAATGEVNDLGISEVLGVGTSNYRGSPPNRIKNIRNGVSLLNGILIQPGEEFSLLNALRPFDSENGYLPELVIKGDKIEPEIGGGLCQIGTTTFRATMNSGLPVLERQNHSLVVRYYNDPSNGNPGTDATIYEPNPDFRFLNDTGHPILFQAEMDEENYELRFTFWGTSDGRTGSYTPPTLVRWIGTGEPIRVETEDLEPGVEKCQGSHVGADAEFTYTIERPDGTKEETVFTSHYRPLPEICLVGKDPNAPSEEATDAETTPDTLETSADADAPVGASEPEAEETENAEA
jgi:vancomycin resistance protein YoaR